MCVQYFFYEKIRTRTRHFRRYIENASVFFKSVIYFLPAKISNYIRVVSKTLAKNKLLNKYLHEPIKSTSLHY